MKDYLHGTILSGIMMDKKQRAFTLSSESFLALGLALLLTDKSLPIIYKEQIRVLQKRGILK